MDGAQSFLLVGRTGNGKSSTGNTILGKQAFKARSPTLSRADDVIKHEKAEVDGFNVQVVDGTGVGDCGSDAAREVTLLIGEFSEFMSKLMLAFNAIILVLKYGVRFTKQEKDAVELIKSLFGQDVLKKWGIIVMTHGDNFEMDNEDENGKTFDDWFKEQTGDIQTLITECDNRCVLFNNKERDENKKRVQRHNLMEKVKAVGHYPYTKDDFDKAENERNKLILKSRLPLLQSETNDMVGRANELVRGIDRRMKRQPEECIHELRSLQQRLQNYRERLENMDRGSRFLNSLLTQITVAEQSVKTKMNQCELFIPEQNLNLGNISTQERNPIISEFKYPLWRRLWKNENIRMGLVILLAAVVIGVILLAASFG